jgi:hypothetical protein
MPGGFEEAKAQRNWLERLGEKIPGFRGFQDRELRREVDRMQREHLAGELARLKLAVRGKARAYTDAGQLETLDAFDRLDRRLDGLSQSVRFTDYGATGFFDAEKIHEPELDRLYRFDLTLLEDLANLGGDIAAIALPDQGEPRPALEQALARVGALEDKWATRRGVMSGVVQR